MDVLNRACAQFGELVKGMPPGARVTAAGALALVTACTIWLASQRDAGPHVYLMGGESFSAGQLRDMEGAFGKAGLADYEIDGQKVRVPRGQQARYMAVLADESALPAEFGDHLKQTVSTQGFTLSGWRQEAQTKVAIQHELQLVIQRMRGIEKAFVHIAEETSRGFPQTKTVTASVGVEPRGDQPLDDATAGAIRSFVASAWGGLKPEAVTVLDLSGNRVFSGPGGPDGRAVAGAEHRSTNRRAAAGPLPPAASEGQGMDTSHSPAQAVVQAAAVDWLARNWQSLGMAGLILVGLIVLRSTIKTAPNQAAAGEVSLELPPTEPAAVLPTVDDRAIAATASLRTELADTIRQNPQVAAGVLRSWLGTARAGG
jgi:flagellar biosynthesis/type III secretory pathway M-ring protein FliF/YscJ